METIEPSPGLVQSMGRTGMTGVIARNQRGEDGASAVEYGLLLTGIAALIAMIVFLFGQSVLGLFDNSCDALSTGSSGQMASC
ncbi:MAG: Flp/Fap pilin component [Marmoricola sp.]|nr:Flp/Fap pilin component [Marmoricola sp.]